MKKKTIELTFHFNMEYDETSVEFLNTLESYKELINKSGDEHDMLEHIAYNLLRRGGDHMIEGVGYVMVDKSVEDEELYSGVKVDDDDPLPEVTIY